MWFYLFAKNEIKIHEIPPNNYNCPKIYKYCNDLSFRHLEEDYLNTAMTVEELTIAAEPEALDIMLCPVCLRNELKLDDKNPRKWQHVCVDCQNMTCSECGKFESSLTTKVLFIF